MHPDSQRHIQQLWGKYQFLSKSSSQLWTHSKENNGEPMHLSASLELTSWWLLCNNDIIQGLSNTDMIETFGNSALSSLKFKKFLERCSSNFTCFWVVDREISLWMRLKEEREEKGRESQWDKPLISVFKLVSELLYWSHNLASLIFY